MGAVRMPALRCASIDRAFPLESVVGGSLKETRNSESGKNSGERKTEKWLLQEDNPFPVYRLVAVHLQEKTAERIVRLPRLRFTPQARPARLLLPISMDQKGKKGTPGEGLIVAVLLVLTERIT